MHYAAELERGFVLEIYPATAERSTGRLRLGLTVPASARLSEGEHELTDPDGRIVVVTVGRAG
ncbi:hypothetical protein GCM10009836_71020 [Pseudonocardia ailaonensis]|uniref:Uncharacterized protein n=1 Tax=Pseudonocardia ailaonensis TaxID=367279 RepID=A0ABN2NR67_9PSEU